MIKLKKGYLLHEIAGIPYLLPYGQNVADFRRSIRLNESGLMLYRALEQGADEQLLLAALAEHYGAKESDIPALEEDVRLFLLQLQAAGILTPSVSHAPAPADFFFQIGPAVVSYDGPEQLLAPSFFDFSCQAQAEDLAVRILTTAPDVHADGELLIHTEELIICRNEEYYLFSYPAGYGIAEMHVSLDGRQAVLFCPRPFASDLAEKVFHIIRFAYLICVQSLGAFALHSASILYQDKAWLFSGSSGSGKSTHASLWNRQFGTPYLNGDLNLLGFMDGRPIVYGIPWCGTSGQYTAKAVPLGGITFLKQAPTDGLLPMTAEETVLRTMQRLISPSWTEEMLLTNLSFVEKLGSSVPFFHLQCTKEDSAAIVMKQEIDKYRTKWASPLQLP